MFTTIRQYRCDPSKAAEIAHRTDESFADQLAEQPGFVAYELIDCGNGDLFTLSVFSDRESSERSTELAVQFIREHLSGVELERTGVYTGEVLVNRALQNMLEMVHA
jgi:hypothetical protein